MNDPFDIFSLWFKEACLHETSYPDAMCLSTVSREGKPHSRQILLKHYSERGFIFFTHTQSQKGEDMQYNRHVALNFYWRSLQKQVRIEGQAYLVADRTADAYFESRPRESQLGAWASKQSRVLASRSEIEDALSFFESEFEGDIIPRPPHWTGYCVVPDLFEFWTERPFRLHDRSVFEKEGNGWRTYKLYP